MSPTVESRQFGALRELKIKDVHGMLEWMHDDEIASVFQQDFKSMQSDDVLSFIKSSQLSTESINFAVVNEDDEYMGTISLKHIDERNRCAEYAIAMRSVAHGTGLAKKGTEDVLRYAFEHLRLHRVFLNVRADNIRAKKFYEKAGFSYEGTSKESLFSRGKWYDLDWYAVVSDEG